MLADIIIVAVANPFTSGLVLGAVGVGAPVALICWHAGYDRAIQRVIEWMKPKLDDVHGDVPTVPEFAILSEDIDQTWGR